MFLSTAIVTLFSIHAIVCEDVNTIDVKTSSGVVRGQTLVFNNKSIDQFLGIPYAVPPLGALRFSKPKSIDKPAVEIIDATAAKFSCMQKDGTGLLKVSEDCLVVDVWSPHRGKSQIAEPLKPVMFWIYGGSLTSGSIFLPTYDGRPLVTHDVVIVSVNYRLGAFGFLYGGEESAPGDVGFFDQLLALKWTRENIHLFGGDKDQITIFGESAGSWSVSAQILSPQSRGLFKRAILESGAVFQDKKQGVLTKENALLEAKEMAKSFKCTDPKDWLNCLRKVDAKDILTKHLDIFPIIGTEFLPLDAQHSFATHNYSADIDIMAGVMRNEGSMLAHMMYPASDGLKSKQDFVDLVKKVTIPDLDADKIVDFYLHDSTENSTKHAFWEFFGDLGITCPTYHFAKQFAQNSPNKEVYFYDWTQPALILGPIMGCTTEMGVCHAADIEYVFGMGVLMKLEHQEFSESVMKMWTNFAKTGKPMDGTAYHWPRMIDSKAANPVPKMKEINPKKPDTILDDLFAKTCDGFWKSYYL